VAHDPSQLQAGSAVGASGNHAVAQSLAQLGVWSVSGLGNQTFVQSYAQTVSKLGRTLSSVNDDLLSSKKVAQMLANERGPAHSMPPGDERTELRRYRQAYAVSAKTVTTLDEMAPVE
jgi:flagellar hook-associated protein FlgK